MITKVEKVSKELKELAIHTNQWLNNIFVDLYIKDGMPRELSINMHGFLKKKLKEVFGRQSYVYTTWYRDWSWLVEYKGYIFLIRSSRRGTSYWLVSGNGEDKAEICYEFYWELFKMYNS